MTSPAAQVDGELGRVAARRRPPGRGCSGSSAPRPPPSRPLRREADPLGHDRERDRPLEHVVAPQPQAAAPAPGTLGVGHQRVAQEQDRVVRLGLLDRRVLGVLDVRLDAVHAVESRRARRSRRPASRSTRSSSPVRGFAAAERDVQHRALRVGGGELGQDPREAPGARSRTAGRPRPRRRRSPPGAPSRGRCPRRVSTLDDLVEAVVDGDVGVDHAAQRVGAGGAARRPCRVDRGRALVVRAGQVEHDPVVVDRDPRRDPDRLVAHAVVVEVVALPRSCPAAGRRWPRSSAGACSRAGRRCPCRRPPCPRSSISSPSRAQADASRSPAGRAGRPRSRAASGRSSASSRQDGRGRRRRSCMIRTGGMIRPSWICSRWRPMLPGRPAADVDVMRHRHRVGERPPSTISGATRQTSLRWRPPRWLSLHRIASPGLERRAVARPGCPGTKRAIVPEVDRLGERLRDRPRPPVEQRAREVEPRLDVGRVGGAPERDAHLVGDPGERVAEDLEAERVGRVGAGSSSVPSRRGHAERRPAARRRRAGR